MKEMKTTCKNLIFFLFLTFSLPLLCIFLQLKVQSSAVCFILYGIQAASPTISALIVFLISGKGIETLKKIFKKKHLLSAILYPLTVSFATMLSAKLLDCVFLHGNFSFGQLSVIRLIMIAWAFGAEEIGWRGFLEPTLNSCDMPHQAVPCIVGTIWCLWHYHYFLQDGVQVPILLFFSCCIIESYIYSFFMHHTENNILSAMSYHFSWNLFFHMFAINPSDTGDRILPYILLTIIEASLSALFWYIKKTNIMGNKSEPI